MAHLSFIARKDHVASYRLVDSHILGRSLDCNIFIPDVFVSRQHCQFELSKSGWVVTDLDSRNGLFLHGRRIKRRVLHDGDLIELGTIALLFSEADIDPADSNPAPCGQGPSVIELVDTLCTGGHRAGAYLKRNRRQPSWLRPVEAPIDGGEWTELDLELQIDAGTIYCRDHVIEMLAGGDWEETELDVEWSLGVRPIFAPVTPPTSIPVSAISSDHPSLSALEELGPRDLVTLSDLPLPDRVKPQRRPPAANAKALAPALTNSNPPAKPNKWEVAMGIKFDEPSVDEASETPTRKSSPLVESSLKEKLLDRMGLVRRLDLRDMVDGVREKPFRSISVAASVVILYVAGSWGVHAVNKPPMYGPDGKLSIHYRNGTDPGE